MKRVAECEAAAARAEEGAAEAAEAAGVAAARGAMAQVDAGRHARRAAAAAELSRPYTMTDQVWRGGWGVLGGPWG